MEENINYYLLDFPSLFSQQTHTQNVSSEGTCTFQHFYLYFSSVVDFLADMWMRTSMNLTVYGSEALSFLNYSLSKNCDSDMICYGFEILVSFFRLLLFTEYCSESS